MSKSVTTAAMVALALGTTVPASAWEARTTSAGVAEQAALSSALHRRLVAGGFARGLFEPLTIPPVDAPALFQALRLLPPSDGNQPDAAGSQIAMAWLAAGAVLADINADDAAKHFFDPSTGGGFVRSQAGTMAALTDALRRRLGRAQLPATALSAPEWAASRNNPLGLAAFVEQYAKAVRAATPAERARHMAGALVAAGALVHILADMGSPSHVRGDTRAHLDQLGAGPDDLGSRFERVAARAYGRLGVPPPARVVTRDTLRGFFTATPAGSGGATADAPLGLADLTAASYFSAYTLPGPFAAAHGAGSARLARPAPTVPARLSVMSASVPEGVALRDARGVCLARYTAVRGDVTFSLDDECMLEQITAILPEVVAYATGLLDYLMRGNLVVSIVEGGKVEAAGATGPVELLAEDGRGVRTALAAGAAIPAGTVRVVALSVGVDGRGEPVVAVGDAPVK